jgi:hypothetical protein
VVLADNLLDEGGLSPAAGDASAYRLPRIAAARVVMFVLCNPCIRADPQSVGGGLEIEAYLQHSFSFDCG